jgi:D-3-phosphoglycerate dehydrogenase
MVLNVDSPVPQPVIEELRGLPGISSMTFAKISDEKI